MTLDINKMHKMQGSLLEPSDTYLNASPQQLAVSVIIQNLMMEKETFSKALYMISFRAWLLLREDFVAFSHGKKFVT
jgi:hypothetical protein